MRLIPQGSTLIVFPQETKNFVTEGNIELIQTKLSEGIVVEVSKDYEDIYKIGQTVVYSSESGFPHVYKGKQCLIIDARSIDNAGHVWFTVIDDEK